jgi:hypothetical protein
VGRCQMLRLDDARGARALGDARFTSSSAGAEIATVKVPSKVPDSANFYRENRRQLTQTHKTAPLLPCLAILQAGGQLTVLPAALAGDRG